MLGRSAQTDPCWLLRLRNSLSDPEDHEKEQINNEPVQGSCVNSNRNLRELTSSFLRLSNLDNGVFERLSRYENALWRQIAQTLLVLRASRYR